MIAIDLSKQQALDLEEAKETVLDFSQGTVKVFKSGLIFISIKYTIQQFKRKVVRFTA